MRKKVYRKIMCPAGFRLAGYGAYPADQAFIENARMGGYLTCNMAEGYNHYK